MGGLDDVRNRSGGKRRLNLSWVIRRRERDRLQSRNTCTRLANARSAAGRRLGDEDAWPELLAQLEGPFLVGGPSYDRDRVLREHVLDRIQAQRVGVDQYCRSFAA